MSTKKLMEAAADILNNTKKNAPAEPMHKVDAEVVDLGGPSPTDDKSTDDSAKIDATKAAKKATAPTTHPSDASSKIQKMKEEFEDEDLYQEDMEAIFANETLSEDFKQKAATIFEARVLDRVTQISEQLESEYNQALEEAITNITEDLTSKIDDYLTHVVEEWVDENQIAIETGLRSELTEEFISGLKNLFAEHYIDVPEEKVDLVEELAGKVEELEEKLDEEIEKVISFKKALVESKKDLIMQEVCEGLLSTQAEKIKELAESVQFSTEEEYKSKLEIIKENYFPSGAVKRVNSDHLNESIETDKKATVTTDPYVAAVVNAISRTKI